MKKQQLFTVFGLLLLLLLPWRVVAEQETVVRQIRHHIAVAFDIDKGIIHATSTITVAPGTSLCLQTGPLTITGAILERENQTPMLIEPGKNKTITIPKSTLSQRLFISWQLDSNQGEQSDNLISARGITLAGFWHPVGNIDMVYSLEAALPKNFTAISEAEETYTTTGKDGMVRFSSTFDHPVANIHFVAGPYRVSRLRHNSTELSTYFFEEDQHLAASYLSKTAEYITLYERLIGPYPYARFSVVENRLPTGYAMPTFTLLGQAVARLPFIKDTSLGHEVLHSWFGNSILLRPESGNWSEGLTTYLADHYYAQVQESGAEYRKNQLLKYRAHVQRDNDLPLESFQNIAGHYGNDRRGRAIGYDKSSMVFHMLRQKLGDEQFFAALKDFYQTNRYSRAGWQDLIDAFASHSSEDLTSFFDQWLTRSDIPSISADNVRLSQSGGKTLISFNLQQHSEFPYALDLKMRLDTIGGVQWEEVSISKQSEPVTLTTKTLPLSMIIDPQYDLMRELSNNEQVPILAGFLESGPKVVLPAEDKAGTYSPLLETLRQKRIAILSQEDVSNSDLQQGNWLFLGQGNHRMSLFGNVAPPSRGFVISTVNNPLNHDNLVVLVDSSSREETAKAAPKLRHYGKYSTLLFQGGQIVEKSTASTDNGIHYPLFHLPSGMPVDATRSFSDIVRTLGTSDVVYVGETHTDYGAHLLQLQIIQSLMAAGHDLIIGMEMFPRSSQPALDRFISSTDSSEKEFLEASRYFQVWGYDYRLYRDILLFAREQTIPVIGLNLDKEITSALFKNGTTDVLTDNQQEAIATERDLALQGYRERLLPVFNRHASPHGSSGFAGFLQAQALWDETMAESIVFALKQYPGKKMVVIAGTGHVNKANGIPPRVSRRLDGIAQRVVVPAGFSSLAVSDAAEADYLVRTDPIELNEPGKIGVVLTETADGVRVEQLSPHGKAGEGGLRPDDILATINGTQIGSIVDVKYALLEMEPGDHIAIEIEREGDTRLFSIQLSAVSRAMMMPPAHPRVDRK